MIHADVAIVLGLMAIIAQIAFGMAALYTISYLMTAVACMWLVYGMVKTHE